MIIEKMLFKIYKFSLILNFKYELGENPCYDLFLKGDRG